MKGLQHPILAGWFDEAVHWFGRWVDGMMKETKETKDGHGNIKYVPKHRLEPLLGLPVPTRTFNSADFGFG